MPSGGRRPHPSRPLHSSSIRCRWISSTNGDPRLAVWTPADGRRREPRTRAQAQPHFARFVLSGRAIAPSTRSRRRTGKALASSRTCACPQRRLWRQTPARRRRELKANVDRSVPTQREQSPRYNDVREAPHTGPCATADRWLYPASPGTFAVAASGTFTGLAALQREQETRRTATKCNTAGYPQLFASIGAVAVTTTGGGRPGWHWKVRRTRKTLMNVRRQLMRMWHDPTRAAPGAQA